MNLNDIVQKSDFDSLRSFVEQNSGIVLGDDKTYLAKNRLRILMKREGVVTYKQLIARAKRTRLNKLSSQIIDAITTNETLWFRDISPFETLKNIILPEIIDKGTKPVRIWSVACSSGQEPYSIAIVLMELKKSLGHTLKDCEIIATDISPSVIASARAGIYDTVSLSRGRSEERMEKFFTPVGPNWRISEEIRKMVTFKEINLKTNFPRLG